MKLVELKNKLGELVVPKKWEPIGKILMFSQEMDMSKYYYGTWELTLKERSPIGVNPDSTDTDYDFTTAGNQFGEKKHTQTLDELVKHYHANGYSANLYYQAGSSSIWIPYVNAEDTYTSKQTRESGGGQPFNVIHPVETVYFYKRIA